MNKFFLLTPFLVLTFAFAEEPLIDASKNEFGGSGSYGCADTVAVASRIGVDYKTLVDTCVGKDTKSQAKAFALFGWLSANAGFDAASSQGHAAVTGFLLRTLGDKRFSELAAKQPKNVKEALTTDICYDLGMLDNYNKDREKAQKNYPLTIKLLNIHVWLAEYDKQP